MEVKYTALGPDYTLPCDLQQLFNSLSFLTFKLRKAIAPRLSAVVPRVKLANTGKAPAILPGKSA